MNRKDGAGWPLEVSLGLDTPGDEPAAGAMALRRMVAQLVLDTSCEGIWLIDVQARTTFVNRAAAELLGYSEDEMLGMTIFEFMDEDRRAPARENLMRRQRGVEDRQELKLRRKDGTSVWVIGSANPVYDRDGRYAGALGLFGDLAPQKEREHRLRGEIDELRRQLAKLDVAKERTREAPRATTPAEASPYREPFRTAIVLGTLGSLVAGTVILAAGSIFGGLLRKGLRGEPREP
jgi:PAS domain S-box-containing protein